MLVVKCNLLLVFLSCTAIKNQQHEEVLQSVRDGSKITFAQSAQHIILGRRQTTVNSSYTHKVLIFSLMEKMH